MAMRMRDKARTPKELQADRDSLLEKLKGITQNPEVLRKAEEFHRKASNLSAEELLRRFTI